MEMKHVGFWDADWRKIARLAWILMVTFLFLPIGLQAQIPEQTRRSDVLRFADAMVHTTTSPVRWKGKDWLKLGGVIAGTAALTIADAPMRNFWLQRSSGFLEGINEVGYHYGKPYSAVIPAGAFYLTGLVFSNEWSRETGMALATAFFTSTILEGTLKPLAGRARPITGESNYTFTFYNEEPGFHSFPSSHASTAFTISFILARRVKSVPLKILFYSLAASTVICRLYSDAHWTSDIVFGSTIAWFCSDAALRRLAENRFRGGIPRKFLWSVAPAAGGLTVRAGF